MVVLIADAPPHGKLFAPRQCRGQADELGIGEPGDRKLSRAIRARPVRLTLQKSRMETHSAMTLWLLLGQWHSTVSSL